jgi:phosphoribosylaminoimidazole-succinocarboxamide synthase
MDVTRGALVYEGKAKQVYEVVGDPSHIVVHFKDDATAFNGGKRASVAGKGVVNARFSAFFMERLAAEGVPVAFVRTLGPREELCRRVTILPVEVVVRNVVAGSLARRLGLPEGTPLAHPVVEHFYKSDALNDPPINEDVATALGYGTREELATMRALALRVNAHLQAFWTRLGITLVDFKVEFGRDADGVVRLADEISPDGSRLWETATGRKLDKDVFRRDLGDLGATYRELLERVFGR